MQPHNPSEVYHLEEFRRDPVGSTVQLEDGTEAEVVDVLEGEYGHYLKLKHSRCWVHVSRVVALVVYSIEVNPAFRSPSKTARA